MAIKVTTGTQAGNQNFGKVSGRVSAKAGKLARSVAARQKPGTYKVELNRIYSFLNANKGQVRGQELSELQALAKQLRSGVKKAQSRPRPDAM